MRFTLEYMRDIDRITDNIRRLMRERDLRSQVKLASAAGISQTNLSNVLRHAISPSLDTLTSIATGLDIETWELLASPEVVNLVRMISGLSEVDRQTVLRVAHSLHLESQSD